MRSTAVLLLCAIAHPPTLSAQGISAVEIVRRACQRENESLEARRQYTFRESAWQQVSKGNGKIRKDERSVRDVFYIGGKEFRKLVLRDGQPLPAKEAAKEQAKLDKQIEKQKKENPADARKRAAKKLRKEREFREQIPEAFEFTLIGEESIAGRACYRIHAEPKSGFRPRGDAKILRKLKGDMWIDKEHYEWARVEAETIDTVTFGGGLLLRLAKGATMEVQQTLVNDEVWFPDRVRVSASGRAMLFLTGGFDLEILYSDFRKYSVESSVTVAGQIE